MYTGTLIYRSGRGWPPSSTRTMESTSDDDLEVATVLARGLYDGEEVLEAQPLQPLQLTPGGRRTVMTNLSRGNTATVTPVDTSKLSIHQLAAKGELCQLQEQLCDMPDDIISELDENGYTPLMWSSLYNQSNVTSFLLSMGACVNASTSAGVTPLMLACCRGSIKVLPHLLSKNGDVNKIDKKGNTALLYAAFTGHADCVSALLQWGADLTMQNKDGLSATDIATKTKNRQVQEAIEYYLLRLMEGS